MKKLAEKSVIRLNQEGGLKSAGIYIHPNTTHRVRLYTNTKQVTLYCYSKKHGM